MALTITTGYVIGLAQPAAGWRPTVNRHLRGTHFRRTSSQRTEEPSRDLGSNERQPDYALERLTELTGGDVVEGALAA